MSFRPLRSFMPGKSYTLRRLYALAVFVLIVAVCGVAVRPTLARQTPQELKNKGDALWNEQSYELAGQAYQQALAKDAHLPDSAEIEFRIAVALVRAEKWDRAVEAIEAFVSKYNETTWEARGQVWRGRLYTLIPHAGYRVGKTITRGSDVPRSNGGEAPKSVELSAEDAGKVRQSFARAQHLFERFRKTRLPETERAMLTREEIELDFDLARIYALDYDFSRYKPGIDWQIDVNAPFDPDWPGPKKVMNLYRQIRALDETLPGTDHHKTVLAALGEAGYIMELRHGYVYAPLEYRDQLESFLQTNISSRRRASVYIPPQKIPYCAIDPIALLQTVLVQYPHDPEADRVQFTIATWTEQKGDTQAAVSLYGAFVSKYPTSRWANDARSHLDNLLRPTLAVNAYNSNMPGQRAAFALNTRNVSQVRFTAYRVYPEEVYGRGRYAIEYQGKTWEAHPQFGDFVHHWNEKEGVAGYRREKVAEWTATTSNDGKHGTASDSVTAPIEAAGAYLIEARAGDHDELRQNTLLFVSDLAVVQKVDKNSVLVYAADSRTGKPVPHVKLLLWEPVYISNYPDRNAHYQAAQTDSEGIYRGALPTPLDESANYTQRRAAVFAQSGPDRYAITYGADFTSQEVPTGERAFRAYITTDRSLYRPRQEVKIRAVVVSGTAGRYQPAVNKGMRLIVHGPHDRLLEKTLTTGAFGSCSDTFTLPAGADLGDYRVEAQSATESIVRYGSVNFRVEEYKKPEFTVSVTPEKTVVRVGETMNVTVSARFFFGAPVTNAKVHYRVRRSPDTPIPPTRSRLDWYDDTPTNGFSLAAYNGYGGYGGYGRYNPYGGYGGQSAWWANLNDQNNGVYREGDLVTDAKGEAHITFSTALPKPPRTINTAAFPEADQRFVITADVVDDSRRQVSGAGSAKATRTQFHAFLNLDRQFVLPPAALTIDVRARDGGDKPFATGGYVRFTRLIPPVPEIRRIDPNTGKYVITQKYVPPREEDGGKLFVQTDVANDGTGKIVWHPDTPGDYRLNYTAHDTWGNDITESASVLVYGPQWDRLRPEGDSRFQMVAEHGDYRIGDTAHVLLVTPTPDSYVLFTEQAIGGIVRSRAVYVPGRSTIINVPITDTHVPNAAFMATLVRDGQMQETGCEVGVPAEDRIFALTVTPDKKQYKPGEKAVFALHAVDAQGRPAQGEISLAVVDQSLLAMQADLAPDIRRFFYGYRMQTQVAGVNSTYYGTNGESFAPPVPAYETHPLVFPEGMGWLLDHLGSSARFTLPNYAAYSPPLPVTQRSGQRRNGTRSRDQFVDYSGAAVGGGYGGMPGSGGPMGEAGPGGPQGETRLSAGRSASGNAQGFLRGISPQDHFALYVDNSLVLRNEDAQAIDFLRGERGNGSALVEATVRRLFADTAFWTPAVVTDGQGQARVTFDFPDNITQWRITARGVTKDIRVGVTEAQAVTKKNLLVRLQAPRFFVDRDQVTISANVHNYLDTAKNARIQLVTENDRLEIGGDGSTARQAAGQKENTTAFTAQRPTFEAQVAKDGETRIDWTVNVRKAGLTKIKVVAQTDTESDAAELEFPVLVHGVEKFIARNGVLRDGGSATETFDLSDLRRKGATLLDVQMSPSLASVMLDALPYLEDYPYGCVEQTTSRFVPTVLVAKTLRDTGIDLETLGKRARVLEEQRRSIPPQQIFADSGYTYPKGVPGVLDVKELSSRLASSYHGRSSAPIFDSAALKSMTDAGLQKLYLWQRADGSWGWWPGSPLGDPYLTAYVVEHLLLAQQADIAVRQDVLDRGYVYLSAHFNSTEDLHLMAYYDYVLCLRATVAKIEATAEWQKTHRFLYDRRDRLNAYGQALLALAHHYVHDEERAGVLVRNLVTTAKRDAERGTAHWETNARDYWHWYNDKQETTALCLRALIAVGEKGSGKGSENGNGGVAVAGKQGENAPVSFAALSAQCVRWLVDNRRGGYWTSTKQTAIVLEALMEYARAQKELTPDYTVTLDVDGKVQKTYHINKENALLFDNRFLVGDEILTSGGQQLHITMQGTGTLYYGAYMKFFDMSEPITAQSNAIAVERKYYRMGKPDVGTGKTGKTDKRGNDPKFKGQLQKSEDGISRIPLGDGAELTSGDIIEVELFLKSDNDYDHLVFEDMKPAGCEAVETRSGVAYGDGLCSNMELRDEKVAFFVDTLPQGTRRLTYRLRAEIPGQFHALPTNAYAMYAPDIRALSDEWRTTIHDAPVKPK